MYESKKPIKHVQLNEKFLPRADVVFSVMFFHKTLFEKTIKIITGETVEVVGLVQEAKNEMKSALLNNVYFDMEAKTVDHRIITLDLQRKYQKERIRNRIVYYACRELGNQFVSKGQYENLQHVVVTFLLTEAPANHTVDCREVVLVDKKTQEVYTDIFRIFEVSTKQIKDENTTEMQILRDFFDITTQPKMDVFVEKYGDTEYGSLLLQQYIYAVSEPNFLADLEKEDKYMLKLTEEDRLMEREEGRAEGRTEGRAEGKWEQKVETVLRMYEKGISLELISDITSLKNEDITKILTAHKSSTK